MGQLCKTRGGWDEARGQAAARGLRLQVSSCKPPGTGTQRETLEVPFVSAIRFICEESLDPRRM